MKIGTVTRQQIEEHPTRSLLPRDYLDPDYFLDRDVTVRITGEAARYVRKLQSKVGGTYRGIVQRIVETEAGIPPKLKFPPPELPGPYVEANDEVE
jgi:hypothetical protein